jgi:hypothetical protein
MSIAAWCRPKLLVMTPVFRRLGISFPSLKTGSEKPTMKKLSKAAQARWIDRIFAGQVLSGGGIAYRSVSEVKKNASLGQLKAAIRKHKYHLVQIGTLYVIVGHTPASLKFIC